MRRLWTIPLLLLAFAPTATAAISRVKAAPPGLNESVATTHFLVHFTSAAGDPNATTPERAATIGTNAEAAYAEYVAWGYPVPHDDGDGRTDIDVFKFTDDFAGHAYSVVGPGTTGTQFPGRVELTVQYATGRALLAHEYFHVIQFGMFAPAPSWIDESTARWAEHEGPWKDGWATVPDTGYLSHPELSFDCVAAGCPAGTWDGGYERWIFWSFLSNRYGRGFVHELYDSMRNAYSPRGPNSVLAQLDATLRAHNTTLAAAWNDFAVANATRSYPAVAAGRQAVATQPITVGTTAAPVVSHLAAHYLEIAPASSACTATTLHVRVAAPAVGTPYVVVGNQATATANGAADVPWQTCGPHPLVVLANTTTTSDNQTFTVTTSVESPTAPTTPSTPTTPPAAPTTPTTPTAPTTPPTAPATGSADPAPSIALLGMPSLLKLRATRFTLSLTASREGRVRVEWDGGGELGTFDVTLGTNTLRIVLPRKPAGRQTLVLTGLSRSGTAGASVRQAVQFVR